MTERIKETRLETRLAENRTNELKRHVIPLLTERRNELKARGAALRIKPEALGPIPEGTYRVLTSVSCSVGLIEGAIVTADPSLSCPSIRLLPAAELEALKEGGFVR